MRIHRDPDIAPDELPKVLDGAAIAIVDHTALPTAIARNCAGLKHVVFLGTGARSYMNPEELAELGIAVHLIKGYGDTAVAECAIALDVGGRARHRRDGPGNARRRLAARGRHAAHRQDARADRLRRHRRRSGAASRAASACGYIAWNRTPKVDAERRIRPRSTRLLAESDAVSLHLLLNDETRGFLSRRADRRDEAGRASSSTPRAARWSTRPR